MEGARHFVYRWYPELALVAIGAGFFVYPKLGFVLAWFFFWTTAATFSSTILLHRAATHGALKLHPAVTLAFRILNWLTTGMELPTWVALHRKHHASPDRLGDPHSPVLEGLWRIQIFQVWYYRRAIKEMKAIPGEFERFSAGTPNDWLERYVFSSCLNSVGVVVMAVFVLYFFGWQWAMPIWLVQMAWMPLAGGEINGAGHSALSRDPVSAYAKNIVTVDRMLGGEALHGNHHLAPKAGIFAWRRGEVDGSAWLICLLERWGLAWDVYRFDGERVACTARSSGA